MERYPINYCNKYTIHYNGPIPLYNRDTPALDYAKTLEPLRYIYTTQWLNNINVEVAKTLTDYNIATWQTIHNDTTPYYRTGSKYNYID